MALVLIINDEDVALTRERLGIDASLEECIEAVREDIDDVYGAMRMHTIAEVGLVLIRMEKRRDRNVVVEVAGPGRSPDQAVGERDGKGP